ncbi:Glycine betaine/proline transport system ATP-binding protein OS=Ureibacillus acetophenoni OX=614649 GN=SAMN05877842_11180 PE=3 SV=1 [Ureibacillus acetophenoni]
MPTVQKDMYIQDVLSIISDSKTPLAVVQDEKLVGVLIRGVVIEALSSSDENQGVKENVPVIYHTINSGCKKH